MYENWCKCLVQIQLLKIYIIDYIVSNIFIGLYSFFVTGGRKKSKIRTFQHILEYQISFNIYYILLTFCKSHAHMFSHISLSTLTFVVYKYIRFTFWCFKYFFKSKIITNLYQYQCSMFTHTYIYKSVIPLCLFHFDIIR